MFSHQCKTGPSCNGLFALVGAPRGVVSEVALLLADNITSGHHIIMLTETSTHRLSIYCYRRSQHIFHYKSKILLNKIKLQCFLLRS